MNWLITGGCGFIGTSLVKFLYQIGNHRIRVIDNLEVGTLADLGSVCNFDTKQPNRLDRSFSDDKYSVEFVQGDILDPDLALRVCQEAEVIVHLAANTGVAPSIADPRADCVTNVIGTLNYLEAARKQKVQRFVFASSGGTVIGDCEPPINEEMVPHPKSPYGASKSAGEGYCSAYFGTFGIETVALRFSNVYGPGSNHKNSVVAKFIRRALQGEPLEVYGDGVQTRDFIFIDDLVQAIYLAATAKNVGGEVFQIATSSETSVNEIAEKLQILLGQANIKDVTVHHSSPRLGEIRRNFSDTTKAKMLLDWLPKTSLDAGLIKTIDWFTQQAQ